MYLATRPQNRIINWGKKNLLWLKLVSYEFWHFFVIALLFPQIRGFSDRFVLCDSIWKLFFCKFHRICFFLVKKNIYLIKKCLNLLNFFFNKFNEFQCKIFNFDDILFTPRLYKIGLLVTPQEKPYTYIESWAKWINSKNTNFTLGTWCQIKDNRLLKLNILEFNQI